MEQGLCSKEKARVGTQFASCSCLASTPISGQSYTTPLVFGKVAFPS